MGLKEYNQMKAKYGKKPFSWYDRRPSLWDEITNFNLRYAYISFWMMGALLFVIALLSTDPWWYFALLNILFAVIAGYAMRDYN